MKWSYFIFLLYIFNFTSSALEQEFSGSIVEITSKKPVEGALLVLDNKIIASTDSKGKFIFNLYVFDLEEEVDVVHVSYQSQSFKLSKFTDTLIIELKENYTQLEEVIIDVEKKLTNRQILKKANSYYKKYLRKDPYWANVNLRQVMNYEDSLQSYLEIDGNMYTLAGNRDYRAIRTMIVPLMVRRTKEDWSTSKYDDVSRFKGQRNYFESSYVFLNYTFLETYHPLSKKGKKYYDYTIDKTVVLNDELCYLINYKEKKPFADYKNVSHIVRGQLWIAKDNFSIKKMSMFINYENLIWSYYAYTIVYNTNDKIIFPKHISYSVSSNQEKLNYQIEGNLDLVKIDNTPTENYGATVYDAYFFSSYIWEAFNKYDEAYWRDKPLQYEKFKIKKSKYIELSDMFKKGASQEITTSKKSEDIFKVDAKLELLKLMKRDLNIKDN